ncbi:MAG: short-chain dehydrogenase [Calditrichaeota bacterium]|nr:short-chain dehydrogenase [Calditrichota bacterium]
MHIQNRRILILGGFGLVGTAVCRELLKRSPAALHIHSLRLSEAEKARDLLLPEKGQCELEVCEGDIFSRDSDGDTVSQQLFGQVGPLRDNDLPKYNLYRMLAEIQPDIVIDCVNTATGIAYRNIFRAAEKACVALETGDPDGEAMQQLLESLYIPRLIRHIQVLYRGMTDCATGVYIKVGTTGTGGMGMNVPYTHSEEKPSRMLLSKSALAGAHSMLLFLMARTPDAPITKELKPAAAIGWKSIGYGPINRKDGPIRMVNARPMPLGQDFSTFDPSAAELRDDVMENVYIDTGENGIFSLEEFSALTTSEQMEFITPEEIAAQLVYEIEGGNTGFDIINALDNTTMGPSYRAGLMRHWALEKMVELEKTHDTHSVAFEMLGPPRLSKLLFESHLLRLAYGKMSAVRKADAADLTHILNTLVLENPEVANRIVSTGIPILLDDMRLIRGQKVILPSEAEQVSITDERLETWVNDGWVDLRAANCARWIQRFRCIHEELQAIPREDTSSRHLRQHRFWHEENLILPGKIAGWVFAVEDHGSRMK